MKILLFGRNGQIARRLYSSLLPLGQVIVCGSDEVDFENFTQLRECIKSHKPDVVINASGYTQVDGAESCAQKTFLINAEAVKVIAEETTRINAWLVHYSTDYVFDGNKKGKYTEDDLANPLNVYGRSKLAGDNYITSISKKHLIFRTSWVFDTYGSNFPKAIFSLARKNQSIRVIDDQIGAPTSASLIANITALALYKILISAPSEAEGLSGIYNLSATGEVSWYGFAHALLKQAHKMGVKLCCLPENIIPILSQDYHALAKRPINSRLDTNKLKQKFGIAMPEWNLCIPSLLDDLKIAGIL